MRGKRKPSMSAATRVLSSITIPWDDAHNKPGDQDGVQYNFYEYTETVIPNYQIKWNSIIQNEVLLVDLPHYLRGEISADELIEKMNQAVVRFNYERGAA